MRHSPQLRPQLALSRFDTHQDQAIVVGSLVVGAWLLGNSIYLIVS